MRLLIAIGLVSVLLFSGCGYKQGISTGDQKAFLYFSGNTQDISVSIDSGELFSVQSGRNNQYEIEPGKHSVKVYRKGTLIIEREVYVGDGIAKEIGVN